MLTYDEVLQFARALLRENTAMRNELADKTAVLRMVSGINPYGSVENATIRDEATYTLRKYGNEP